MFKDKVLLVTGGTGSFGNAVMERFLDTDIGEIRVFSRDEKKQDDMRQRYANPKLKFYIGDVRDYGSISGACRGVDYIFHAAALKQVPSCEFNPMEAVKTNVMGTANVLEAAINNSVKRVVCLSTDKAVYPINAMGMSKALMEKVMIAKSRNLEGTVMCGVRYGNVMGTRGSVIPLFMGLIASGKPLTITDPNMTRFMMALSEAIALVLFAFEKGRNGDMFIQKSPAATMDTLANALTEVMGAKDHPIEIIGSRHGEKLFETLVGCEEMARAEDMGQYFRIPADMRDMNYANNAGKGGASIPQDYNSHNTERLDISGVKDLLIKMNLSPGAAP